jgi:hypothetical protein
LACGRRDRLDSRPRRAARRFACALLIPLAGCSDGAVKANGRVLIEGENASGGRVLLTPIGGGTAAFSLVGERGEFALRSGSERLGAQPGNYRILFQRPLSPETRAQLARELAGQIRPEELTETFRAPGGTVLTIPESGDDNLTIDIRQDQGWTLSYND